MSGGGCWLGVCGWGGWLEVELQIRWRGRDFGGRLELLMFKIFLIAVCVKCKEGQNRI